MLVISIPSADLRLHQKIEENINGRANFMIVVVERQNVLASDISKNRPIWTWISMIEK